jgi:predicted XRE-type DNA-binding protein
MVEPLTDSTGNVFTDLGFPPEEASVLHMRATLLSDLREYVRSNDITIEEASERLGITRSRVQDLLRGHWEKFGLEILITMETRLGRSVTLQLAA